MGGGGKREPGNHCMRMCQIQYANNVQAYLDYHVFLVRVGACTCSFYQALFSPTLREPEDEAEIMASEEVMLGTHKSLSTSRILCLLVSIKALKYKTLGAELAIQTVGGF